MPASPDDLLNSLNDALPDDLLSTWGPDGGGGGSNGLTNGSLEGIGGNSATSQPGPTPQGMPQQNMGMMRPQGGMPMQGQPGQGMPMPSNGPNGQVMVNRTVSQPGQMPNSHSISDSSMGPQGLVSMAPMTSMPSDMQGTVVSSMGPQSQAGMVPGMRPGMNMGMVGQQTIISSQMNGPNTMVRTVGQNMGGMGGMQLRQGVPGMMPGGNRMITPGVRMPNVGVSRNVCVPLFIFLFLFCM